MYGLINTLNTLWLKEMAAHDPNKMACSTPLPLVQTFLAHWTGWWWWLFSSWWTADGAASHGSGSVWSDRQRVSCGTLQGKDIVNFLWSKTPGGMEWKVCKWGIAKYKWMPRGRWRTLSVPVHAIKCLDLYCRRDNGGLALVLQWLVHLLPDEHFALANLPLLRGQWQALHYVTEGWKRLFVLSTHKTNGTINTMPYERLLCYNSYNHGGEDFVRIFFFIHSTIYYGKILHNLRK